jgi:hypothetical protein
MKGNIFNGAVVNVNQVLITFWLRIKLNLLPTIMSDLKEKPRPNYAPVYAAALYPEFAQIFRSSGWALAVHGSLARDFDLIAIPWIEQPLKSDEVVAAIKAQFAVKVIGEPDITLHGRERWTLSIGFGSCFVDLSFMPVIPTNTGKCLECGEPWRL